MTWAYMAMSLPSLGAWIETIRRLKPEVKDMSLPSLGAWIETCGVGRGLDRGASRSLHWERGLKRRYGYARGQNQRVAPFIGSVD